MPTIYNKVVLDGTTLMDISDTTATASDVAQGKYFYTTAGVKTEGTASGSSGTPAISVVDTTDSHGGTIREITALDISDTTAIASDVVSGKYFYTSDGTKTLGTASGSGSGGTGQTATGTVTGDGTNILEIPCNFAPDLIYVYGDMSEDVANRGITSLTIIKDTSIYVGADTSTSSIQEYVTSIRGITGYNESDVSDIHATYSNGTLTINTMSNSSSGKWRSGQVYNYELSTIGTGGGTPSATSHMIYFEFSDNTNTTITGYWDNSFISSAITATTPTTYGQKTVTLAQLDEVTWYEPTAIPLNTQLVDYTKCLQNTAIDSSGQEVAYEWYYASDYSPIATGMTFTFICGWWTYVAFYDSSKTFIRAFTVYNSGIATQDEQDNNLGHGTLTGNTIPPNASYIRMASTGNNANYMSLIRTA